ncbi:MAG: hemerythrin domain-containing protein [Ignavibacteriales bacterium]|nr:hemerythrin domain-containing protein [Ignavibacteriales bacterium]
MNGPLYKFFVEDHRRLEKLLNHAAASAPKYDMTAYGEFRVGLLKHIKMEENVIIPAAQKVRDGIPLAIAPKLRLDHGALVALLVPPPSPTVVKAIRGIMSDHNRTEESQGGLYDLCERLAGEQIDGLMKKVEDVPEVPALPHRTGPNILDAAKRALERAGYDLDDYSSG